MNRMLQPNPIIVKELRSRMRGGRPYLILTGCLLALSLVCFGVLRIFQGQADNGMMVISAHVGQGLFAALALAEMLLVVFLTPALTAGAISGEREQLTYDLLIATPLRPGRILSGKLVAAIWYVLLLIFAAVPLGSIVLLYGGISPRDLLKALLLLLLTALATGMLGLLCSSIARRTLRATIMAYLLILLIISGVYFYVILRGATQQPGMPIVTRAVAASPFSAMASVVMRGGIQAQGGVMMDSMMPRPDGADLLMNMPPLNTFAFGLVDYNNMGGPAILPAYRYAYVGYALFAALCYWLAGHFVRPQRRWRLGWHDLAMLVLVTLLFTGGTYWLDVWPWQAWARPAAKPQPGQRFMPNVEPAVPMPVPPTAPAEG
jgi:ABC-2 type transport system permease protein